MGNQSISRDHQQPQQKTYEHIEQWRSRSLFGGYPYVYVDGVYLKCSWGGEIRNVSILVAIGVSSDGYHEIIGDKHLGMLETIPEVFRMPDTRDTQSIFTGTSSLSHCVTK